MSTTRPQRRPIQVVLAGGEPTREEEGLVAAVVVAAVDVGHVVRGPAELPVDQEVDGGYLRWRELRLRDPADTDRQHRLAVER
jgi:hypothetical protein